MKILQIADSPWSIGKLCDGIRRYNTHIEWEYIFVPPRDIDANIEKVKRLAKECDMIDFQYWNVAWQLVEKIPELKSIPKILTHHNQKNILSKDWSGFDALTCKTDYSYNKLNEKYPGKIFKIENCPDFDYFKWVENYPPEEPAVGYCGRICAWKGLKEIARACYELGYPLYFMGRQDKVDYWNEIPDEYKDIIRWDFMDVKDDERLEFYQNISIYVGNSREGRESGTLPFLEAMACGVPVVTTANGMAMDIVKHEESALIVNFEDYEDLKANIKRAMEDKELRMKLRKNGWNVVKNFTYERMARQYSAVYNHVLHPDMPLASVIIPATYDRVESVQKIVDSLNEQTYGNIEIIVVWDEKENKEEGLQSNVTLKSVRTESDGYNLAMARNMGIIESEGEVVIFCDSRLNPEQEAVTEFVKAVLGTKDKKWFFGDKGSQKKSFVENFSAIRREYIIKAGMFNERVNRYGGMSQELRNRFQWQGFTLEYLDSAKSQELRSSKLTVERREDIRQMKNLMNRLNLW